MRFSLCVLAAVLHLADRGRAMKQCTPLTGRFVDLSYEYNDSTPSWITHEPLRMKVTANGTESGYWMKAEEIAGSTHSGTHLDAPCHFAQGRWCVSDIPVERLVVPVVVIDLTSDVGDNADFFLSVQNLEQWENVHGKIPDGSVVLLYTGWSRFWSDRLRYFGTADKDATKAHFPSVSPQAAQWLVDNRKIYGLGLDTPSVDSPASGEPQPRAHQILEEQNIFGLENVANTLGSLPATGAIVYVSPMKLKDSSGAPCRIYAFIPSKENCTGCGSFCSSAVGVMVSTLMLALAPMIVN